MIQTLTPVPDLEPETPSDDDAALARVAGPQLAALAKESCEIEFRVGKGTPPLRLPALSVRLLANILGQIGEGNAVAVVPVESELTTQQAADVLNVSRPYLVKLLEEGKLPHRKVGSRRRVLLCDVLAYKRAVKEAREKVLDELAAQAQELNMGY